MQTKPDEAVYILFVFSSGIRYVEIQSFHPWHSKKGKPLYHKPFELLLGFLAFTRFHRT